MTHRPNSRVLVVAIVSVILAAAQAGHATTPLVAHPPAGPWYTPSQLRQLKAYSAMSFAEKQKFLAGVAQSPARVGKRTRLAGPTSARTRVFHWRDAAIGAAAALIVALLTVSVLYAISRTKNHRRGLRPT